jgi:catechol-2,3-dioxygenase
MTNFNVKFLLRFKTHEFDLSTGLAHIALVSSSEEEAKRFYKEGLGLRELRSPVIYTSRKSLPDT